MIISGTFDLLVLFCFWYWVEKQDADVKELRLMTHWYFALTPALWWKPRKEGEGPFWRIIKKAYKKIKLREFLNAYEETLLLRHVSGSVYCDIFN